MERRQEESKDGTVDLTECIAQWAYDLMVCVVALGLLRYWLTICIQGDIIFGGRNGLEMMKSGDPDRLIMGGKLGTALLDRSVPLDLTRCVR